MLSMKEINSRIDRLQQLRRKAEQVDRLREAQKILDNGMSAVFVRRVLDSAEYGLPIDLSLILTKHENEVLNKTIWVILDLAVKRIEKEADEA